MKYTSTNRPLVCMQTHSDCYRGTSTDMKVLGVLWHSTGANNPTLKRYVQPWDNSSNKEHTDNTYTNSKWHEVLGTNSNRNDWNHSSRQAGLNCWIGKLADGTVTTVQTMPWRYKPWGCGSGSKGSCNSGWIQFEICEDGLLDKDYFSKAYTEACELTAYICKLYNIDPKGTVTHNGVKVPTILCHQDSYKLGLGSNHGDVYHWFKHHGKTMDSVRNDVMALLVGSDTDLVVNDAEQVAVKELTAVSSLTLKNVSTNSASINIEINENFNTYSWFYDVINLKTGKSEISDTILIEKTSTELVLKSLKPNTAYSVTLTAKDELKNEVRTPGFIFNTQQEYPSVVKNVTFDMCTGKVSFEPVMTTAPNSDSTRGYKVSIYVNGYEQISNDVLISYSSSSTNVANLLNNLSLQNGDTIQVGIAACILDTEANYIFSPAGPSLSKPIYIRAEQPLIDKMFLKLDNVHKRALFYNNIR